MSDVLTELEDLRSRLASAEASEAVRVTKADALLHALIDDLREGEGPGGVMAITEALEDVRSTLKGIDPADATLDAVDEQELRSLLEVVQAERDELRAAFAAKRLTPGGQGTLWVSENDYGEIILQLPDEVGWIAFTPDEADQLAALMKRKAQVIRATEEKAKGRKG